MQLNKKLYTLGNIGDISEIEEMMKKGDCGWLYFVYQTDSRPLNIGNLHTLILERSETLVLGIASSKRFAQKLALHIVLKALAIDSDIISGLTKLGHIQ